MISHNITKIYLIFKTNVINIIMNNYESSHSCNALCFPACTAIANCELLSCTSGQNHKCNKCKYTKNANTKAYKRKTAEGVANRICQRTSVIYIILITSLSPTDYIDWCWHFPPGPSGCLWPNPCLTGPGTRGPCY